MFNIPNSRNIEENIGFHFNANNNTILNNLNNNLEVLNQASLLQPNMMFNIPNSRNIEENIDFHFNANNNNNNNPNNTYYPGNGF